LLKNSFVTLVSQLREFQHTATQAELDALDPSSNADKPGIRAGLRNYSAVAQLTMDVQTAGLLDKVNQAKSTDWPNGLAKNIVARLKRDFQPFLALMHY